MPQNPSKPCQEPTCPCSYPFGVMEDRSVLMGFPDGFIGPRGSQGTIVVKHTPPRHASEPPKTVSGTYPSLWLFSWSCGGQECPDRVPGGHYQTANCLRSILSFYRPQKAYKTPKIWFFESCLIFSHFFPIFWHHPYTYIFFHSGCFGRPPPEKRTCVLTTSDSYYK